MLMFLKKMKDKALSFSLFKQELAFFAVVFIAEIALYLMVLKSGFKDSLDGEYIFDTIIIWWGTHLLFIFLFIITNFVYLFTHLSFNDKLIYSDFCKAVFALTIFGIFYFCLSFPFDWMMFMEPPKEDVSGQYMPGGGFMMVLFSFTAKTRNNYFVFRIFSSYCLFLLIVALINLLGWGIKEIIFLTRKRRGGEAFSFLNVLSSKDCFVSTTKELGTMTPQEREKGLGILIGSFLLFSVFFLCVSFIPLFPFTNGTGIPMSMVITLINLIYFG